MHIFPSIYPSSNLSYGNLWAKGNTFVNGPWWIFPSVNLLSWTYVHSLLPPCNMWCDGEKKSSFSLLLETFLVSFHLVPHFVLCHHPFTCLKDSCPCLVWPSCSQLEKPRLITDFGPKNLPEGTWCCSQSGLGFTCCRFGRLELQLFCIGIKNGLKLNSTLFTQKSWKNKTGKDTSPREWCFGCKTKLSEM